jgi:acyl-coenzyme A synthetase/AMP-(fatty) acid ligase
MNGDITWFPEGALNASYNCVDRWALKHPDKVRYHFSVMALLSPRFPVAKTCLYLNLSDKRANPSHDPPHNVFN